MQWGPEQNQIWFECRSTSEPEDHHHPLTFSLVFWSEISTDSSNLMRLWTADYVFLIFYWRAWLWNCSTIFRPSDMWPSWARLFFWKVQPFWNVPFVPSPLTDLLPIKLISNKIAPFIWTTYFYSILLPLEQQCWDLLLSNSKLLLFFINKAHFLSFNIWYVHCVPSLNKYGFMSFANHDFVHFVFI